jgi:hypothetical protein
MPTARFVTLISGIQTEVVPAVTSAGAGSSGQIVALNASGFVDTTMLPVYITGIIDEVPSGTVNGSNTSFTLSHTPKFLMLFLDGLECRGGSGLEYTISGTTITFTTAPETGGTLRAQGFY